MPLKTVLLDVGDTLLHEVPGRAAIYAEAAAELGVPVEVSAMAAAMREAHHGLPRVLDGAFRYSDPWFEAFIARIFCAGLGLPREALPGLAARLHLRFSDPATFRLYPGALELLEALRARGLRVGIVSNWSARLPALLERLEIDRRVDFVLCSALEGCEKPEPEIFARALQQAGARPDEAVHAGDKPHLDVAGARAAGIEGVLVDHAGRHPDFEGPRVTTLKELLALALERAA